MFEIMGLIVGVLAVFVAIAFIASLFYGGKPIEGKQVKASTIDDTADLFASFSYNDGEPLVHYPITSNKDLKRDPWRETLPRYSSPCEERGLVVGASGRGKTALLVAQLVDWMQSGKSFVVTDVKPEIWAILKVNGVFERYGYEDMVINPTDPNAYSYNPFDDIKSFDEIDELLFITVPKEVQNPVFTDNARRLMKSIMYHLKETTGSVSLPAMRDYRYQVGDMDLLLKQLKKSPNIVARRSAQDISDAAQNENFFASILGAFNESLDFLNNEVISKSLATSDISLSGKLQEPRKALFLQFAEKDKAKNYKIFGIMVSHVLRMLQLDHKNRDDVFIAIDEIINSAPIVDLPNRINVMRSAKMPLFMYLQYIEGLVPLYGKEGADAIFSGCALKIVYGIHDPSDAMRFSQIAGQTDVHNTSYSVSNKPLADTGRSVADVSSSHSVSKDARVTPEEIMRMENNHAFVINQGFSGKIKMPVYYQDLPMYERPNFGTVSEYMGLEGSEVQAELQPA